MGRKATVIPPVPLNRKKGIDRNGPGVDYAYVPRVTHRAARGRKVPRFKIACGCCDESFEIYYRYPYQGDDLATLEIAGVDASVSDWREILLPLLGFEQQENGIWTDKE